MAYMLTVNGAAHTVDADPDTPLLWILRENVGLTGTKFGCGVASCGACTVHLDGEAVRSCSIAIENAQGKSATILQAVDVAERGLLPSVQPRTLFEGRWLPPTLAKSA
jgi:isoquinoline 1-oxidoreductase alpha subunit